jgi:hypothetical protein
MVVLQQGAGCVLFLTYFQERMPVIFFLCFTVRAVKDNNLGICFKVIFFCTVILRFSKPVKRCSWWFYILLSNSCAAGITVNNYRCIDVENCKTVDNLFFLFLRQHSLLFATDTHLVMVFPPISWFLCFTF